jgi:hypothetical protein
MIFYLKYLVNLSLNGAVSTQQPNVNKSFDGSSQHDVNALNIKPDGLYRKVSLFDTTPYVYAMLSAAVLLLFFLIIGKICEFSNQSLMKIGAVFLFAMVIIFFVYMYNAGIFKERDNESTLLKIILVVISTALVFVIFSSSKDYAKWNGRMSILYFIITILVTLVDYLVNGKKNQV